MHNESSKILDIIINRVSKPMREPIQSFVSTLHDSKSSTSSGLIENILAKFEAEKSDQGPINALLRELKSFETKDEIKSALNDAEKRGREILADSDLISAFICHLANKLDRCAEYLSKFFDNPNANISNDLKEYLIDLCLYLSWNKIMVRNTNFFDMAHKLDTENKFGAKIDCCEKLVDAQKAFSSASREEDFESVARKALLLADAPKSEGWIRPLAYELVADCCRELGDTKREMEILERWVNLSREYPNGPVDIALFEGSINKVREQQILCRYSRLVFLYEQIEKTRPFAKQIYSKFQNCFYGCWKDPSYEELGTINERMLRLEPLSPLTPSGQYENYVVYEIPLSYGSYNEENIKNIIKQCLSSFPEKGKAAVLRKMDINETHFEYASQRGEAIKQVLEKLNTTLEDTSFRFRITNVTFRETESKWLWCSHQYKEGGRDILNICFGIVLVPIESKFEVTVYVLRALPENISDPVIKQQLTRLLMVRPENLTGLSLLEETFWRVFTKASHALTPSTLEFVRPDAERQGGFE